MMDLSSTTIAKSDQLNSDDLIGNCITIRITKVALNGGEQPVSIHYENDNNKPWKPCKTMCRVLVGVWGKDGNVYVGRSLTLYRDPSVTFGGLAVGGIRISHMSHIEKPVTLVLSNSRKTKKPVVINPLVIVAVKDAAPIPDASFEDWLDDIKYVPTLEGLHHKFKAAVAMFTGAKERAELVAAKDARKKELSPPPAEIVTESMKNMMAG